MTTCTPKTLAESAIAPTPARLILKGEAAIEIARLQSLRAAALLEGGEGEGE